MHFHCNFVFSHFCVTASTGSWCLAASIVWVSQRRMYLAECDLVVSFHWVAVYFRKISEIGQVQIFSALSECEISVNVITCFVMCVMVRLCGWCVHC